MTVQPTIFISYSQKNEAEKDVLLTHLSVLQRTGLVDLWSDDRISPGAEGQQQINQALNRAGFVILLITSDFLASEFLWSREMEKLLVRREREGVIILPIIAKACHWKNVDWLAPTNVRPKYGRPVWSDAGSHVDEDLAAIADEISQLVTSSKAVTQAQSRRIFISYKRHAEPDESLVQQVYQAFIEAGHHVFLDQNLKIGVEWIREIERQIESSDFMIVFLSQASIHSEMVAKEVEFAYQYNRRSGKAQLLPVRVNYTETLPYQLSHYLERLQYAEWNDPNDTTRVIWQLLDTVRDVESLLAPADMTVFPPPSSFNEAAPQPYADPRFIGSLRDPSGAVRLRSEFYIEREGDSILKRELSQNWGTTTTIRAPQQTGKSSLLFRGVAQARGNGAREVFLDLQTVDDRYLASLDIFLRNFCETMTAKLRLDPTEVEKQWQSSLGPSDKATYLLEGYLLAEIDGPVILAIDEADRLLKSDFHDTFFGLLRYWHNQRAMTELWENLDIVLAISTEPHLLISDVRQSPFNVGRTIRLQDFDFEQVQEINRRYRTPIANIDLSDFIDFLGGHPYLTRRALYTLVTEEMSWTQLRQIARADRSPFRDHLRQLLWLVSQQNAIRNGLLQIIKHSECSDEVIYYRLVQAGLVSGSDRRNCQPRCALYAEFFKDKL